MATLDTPTTGDVIVDANRDAQNLPADHVDEKPLAKLKLEEEEAKEETGADADLSDGYVKFIRRPVPAEPKTITLIHAPDRHKQDRAAHQFAKFLQHHRQIKTVVEIIDISECTNKEKFELFLATIGNADRIILIGSKKLTELFQNKANETETFTKDILDIIDRIVRDPRKPGHDRVFAAYFEYSGKGELPRELVDRLSRVHELSCEKPSTIETFYGRLLHRKGVVSYPEIRDIGGCRAGKRLCRSIKDAKRDLEHMSVMWTLISHGEKIGFCAGDFVKNCLDILLQEAVITHEEYTLILRECTLKNKVSALKRIMEAKETHIPAECVKLTEVWEYNVLNDKPKRCLLVNRFKFIDGLACIGPLLDFLQQECVISSQVASAVRSITTDADKTRHLIDNLPNTKKAVTMFREALLKCGHPWLAELIDIDSSDEEESE